MLAAFLVSIITNAFIVLRWSPSNFYTLHRYDGQLLYIKAIFIGSIFTFLAFLLDAFTGVVKYICKLLPDESWKLDVDKTQLEGLLIFFFLTVIISVLWCLLERGALRVIAWWRFGCNEEIPYRKAKIFLMYNILSDSPLDNLLFSSYIEQKVLLITMSDRKVYVGIVINLGEPNESEGLDQEISIVPIYSGYRDKDYLSLKLTNKYDVDGIFIVLKQDKIISACEFVESLYLKLSKKARKKSKSPKPALEN